MNRTAAMRLICSCTLLALAAHATAFPTQQGSAFTYQGLLKSGTTPIDGAVDLQFRLFDAAAAGVQVGSTVAASGVVASKGVFTTTLDFGALSLNGEERWLEIDVRSPAGGAGAFVTLSPRQKLASVPYASRALSAMLSGSYADAVTFNNAANAFTGDGSGLTGLNATNVASGVLSNARTTGTAGSAADTLVLRDATGSFSAGAISATSFTGDGAGLTNLNASAITSGTLADARLSTSLLARIPETEPVVAPIDFAETGLSTRNIFASGPLAFAVSQDGLECFDVADPANIVLLDAVAVSGGTVFDGRAVGQLAHIATSDGFAIYDFSDPENLTFVGEGLTPTAVAWSLDSVGNFTYMLSALNQLQIYNVSVPSAPALVGAIPTGSTPTDIVVSGSYAYVICRSSNVLQVFNISNPASPALVGSIATPNQPEGIALSGSIAVVAAASYQLATFDVSIPASMALLDTLTFGVDEPGFGAYDVQVSGGVAYVGTGGNQRLVSVDISNPSDLIVLATSTDGVGAGVGIAMSGAHVLLLDTADLIRTYRIGGVAFSSGIVQAEVFSGSGSGLTNLNALALQGAIDSDNLGGSYTNPVFFSNSSNSYAGSGFNLINLNATNVASGNLNVARLPTGGTWTLATNLGIDGSTLQIDPVNNRVGIGTSSPQVPLQINSTADAGTTLGTGAFNIVNGVNGLIFDSNEIQSIGGTLSINNNSEQNVTLGGDAIIVTTGDLVGINRTPVANDLEVAGNASKSAAGSWLANSDRRIKTDILTIENALETLDQIRLTSFAYTNAYLKSHPEIEQRRYLNVIAQEFASVFPDHVKGSGEFLSTGEEILQVDTHPLTIYSAAAVQELHDLSVKQQEEIERLKRQQQTLAENMDSLKDELDVRDLTIADLLKRLEALEKQAKEAKAVEPG